MKCPRCQFENRSQAKFCEECGASFARTCANCLSPLSATAKFCAECGQAAVAATFVSGRFGSPGDYTPEHLAERILNSKSALEGERKQVTVLFADLKGSMELLADRDPEEARALLEPVIERMIEAVHRYEGTVNQVMGDGIMALFGAPLALEDHAVRACYAALAMQSTIRAYSDVVRRSRGVPPLQIRAGMNSGEVVVGAIGSDLRMEYTAVGQTTHLAARMEQLAAPGTTLLSGATLQLVEGYVAVKSHGPVSVKGLSEPVEVYELTGAGAARSRLQASAIRGLTKFVGRSAEMAQINQALENAASGHGQLVALVGEPGVGKSRVVWEVVHSHRVQDWLVVESTSVSYGKASAYRPVIDLLKAYFQIEERDDGRRVQERVAGKLLMLDRQLEPCLSPLLFLLEAPVEDAQWQQLDPPQRRLRILDACKRLLLREAQVQSLLLVFEDLHWIDNETQTFLDSLVESLPTASVLLLVNYRPEFQHRWGAKTYYTQLRIDPLSLEGAEALLEPLLGSDPSLASLKRMLIQRTEGNPLFLEESVRTLVETGELSGSRGAYKVSAPVASIQVPATVQAILAARIDRLPLDDKRLLQAAAVIGKDISYPLLQAIAEVPEEQLRRTLTDLQAAEFLYETSLFPDLEYTFKHALTHEVAYGSVLQERRRGLHARILEAMERLYADRIAEHVEQLAHHASRGEQWDKALSSLRQAGLKAYGRSANREAGAYFEQAIEAVSHLPETVETIEQSVDLRLALRQSLIPLSDLGRLLDHMLNAAPLVKSLGDPRREVLLHGFTSGALAVLGQIDDAIGHGEHAWTIAESLKEPGLQIIARFYLGLAHLFLGAHHKAIEFFLRDVGLQPEEILTSNVPEPGPGLLYATSTASNYVLCETDAAYCYAELGWFEKAVAHAEHGLQLAEKLNLTYMRANGYAFLGFVRLRKGEIPRAVSSLEQCISICEAGEVHNMLLVAAPMLGGAYNLAGRTPEAITLLERAWDFAQSSKNVGWGQPVLAHLADSYGRAGRIDEALKAAQRALDLARQYRMRGYEGWTFYLLGNIHNYANPLIPDPARDAYRKAIALAQELGLRPLEAHCHHSLGAIDAQAGHVQMARGAFATAATLYREMGMQFWLSKTELALEKL